MQLLLGIVAIVAIVIVVAALTGFAIAKMKSDTKHGTSGTLSNAMLNVQSLFEPEKERMAESIRADREEESDQSGDPPR